jgi:hypothetical protein
VPIPGRFASNLALQDPVHHRLPPGIASAECWLDARGAEISVH